jgi:hypothetical protein
MFTRDLSARLARPAGLKPAAPALEVPLVRRPAPRSEENLTFPERFRATSEGQRSGVRSEYA